MFPESIAKSSEFKLIAKIVKKLRTKLKALKLIIDPDEFNGVFGIELEHRLYFSYFGYENEAMHFEFILPPATLEEAKLSELDIRNVMSTMFTELERSLIQKTSTFYYHDPGPSQKVNQQEIAQQQMEIDITDITEVNECPPPMIPTSSKNKDGRPLFEEEELQIESGSPVSSRRKRTISSKSIQPNSHFEQEELQLGQSSPMSSRRKRSIRRTSSNPIQSRCSDPEKQKIRPVSATSSKEKAKFNPGVEIVDDEVPGPSRVNTSIVTPARIVRPKKPVNNPDSEDDDLTFGKSRDRTRLWRKSNPTPEKPSLNRVRRWREANPDARPPSRDRTRQWRTNLQQESDTDDEIDDIHDPDRLPTIDLGPQNEECPFCGAMHFSGEFVCCSKGKIFFPPQRKVPEKLAHYLFEDYRGRSEFKKKILSYNNAFAMASMSYHQADIAPHGVQVAKPIGLVGHYTSCATPYRSNDSLLFGNFYVYQGLEALELREKTYSRLDKVIMKNIQEVMDTNNALGKLYFAMGQIIKEQGDDVSYVRMKIVDPRQVSKDDLQGPLKIYREPMISGDHVALFYNATMEQEVKLPGLNIYGKRRARIVPQPVFPSDPRIPGLCYPLFYPYGEIPWRRQTELYLGEKRTMTYIERLEAWAQHHRDWADNWEIYVDEQDSDNDNRPLANTIQSEMEVNIETSAVEADPAEENSEDEDVDENETDYTRQYAQTGGEEPHEGDNEVIDFIERGGELYPVSVNRANRQRLQRAQQTEEYEDEVNDDLLDAIAEEEMPIGEENEMINHADGSTNRDEYQENNENNTSGVDGNVDENATQIDLDNEQMEDVEGETEANEESRKRKFASYREFGLYIHQNRKQYYRNRFSAGGKLGQLQVTDMCARLFEQRYSYAAKHRTEFMTSDKKTFLKAMQRSADRVGRKVGCLTTMPPSIPGSPRHFQKLFEHAVAMCNTMGKSDLFITITCNVGWPEIKENIPVGETWADHPFLVNEVFKKRFERTLELIIGKKKTTGGREKGMFGRMVWYTYSIEFQQRGPPHAHLIVSLKRKIKTAAQVDKICQATLPRDNEELRQLVEDFHIHRPCEDDPTAYCREGAEAHWTVCRKGFPKKFGNTTHLGDRNYPELRRPNDGEKCTKHGYKADNRHVVSYNTTLLTLWKGHINVEVISTLKVLKYIFKYLFKGYDRALVEALTSSSQADASQMTIEGHLMFPKNITMHPGAKKQRQLQAKKMLRSANVPLKDGNGQEVLVLNEFWICQDMRALTSCEAAWEFAAYPRWGSSHTVIDLFVHGEDEEPIMFNPGDEEAMVERIAEDGVSSRFKAWMKLNAVDPEAHQYTYDELPKHYRFVKDRWIQKKHKFANLFGRVRSVHPNNKELFAIRLLSSKQKGVTTFQELRTVNDETHPTFVSAAKALGLMNDQQEWERALREAAAEKMPSMLRRLFVSILSFNPVSDPLMLWNEFKVDFFENKTSWSDQMKEAHALKHIESGLRVHCKTLESCEVNTAHLPQTDMDDDSGRAIMSVEKSRREADKIIENLNNDQMYALKRIRDGITKNAGKVYFIQGSGGSGKTLTMKALYHLLVSMGHKVSCVAHTGIAAMLLPFGSTSHRAFHIPLTVEENMHSNVALETHEAQFLSEITVVFWDEATMTDRRIFSCVDRLMRQLHPENAHRLFGGVPFILGGDWKQTLPIVHDVQGGGVVQYTLLGSELWRQIEVLHLKVNMRAKKDPQFAEYIATIGDGSANLNENLRPEDQMIELPARCLVGSEKELIEKMFGTFDIPEKKKDAFSSASILAVDNKTTFEINEKVLKLIDSPLHEFLSIDEHDDSCGFTALDPEVYHLQTPTGKPPHKLQLKIGAVVILLRNINVFLGLVNGARLVIEKIGKEVVYAKPLNPGPKTPRIIAIHRLMFSPSTAPNRETSFIRTQFPLRLAFCITCNRAQGQTLEKAGLILRTPCFTHGQLYVALSRVRTAKDLLIFNAANNRSQTNNVVFRDALV